MNLALCHSLARRFLGARSQEPLMRFIGKISMFGMALAVAILIIVLSVMNGFEREFRARILSLVPHATLTFTLPRSDWKSIASLIESQADITSVHPFVSAEGLAVRGANAEPILLLGIEDFLVAQRYQRFLNSPVDDQNIATVAAEANTAVTLGNRLAESLGLEIADSFRVLIASGDQALTDQSSFAGSLTGANTSIANLTFDKVIRTGTELDTSLAILPMASLARLKHNGQNDLVDGLLINVKDIFQARSSAVNAVYESGVAGSVSDWSRTYGNLYLAIQLSRQMVVILLSTIIAIAAFNIFVSLGMSVRHRQREIAVLRTMGMSSSAVRLTFSLQGIYLFLPGFLWGAIVGSILALSAPYLVNAIESLAGLEFLDTRIYPIDYLPSQLKLFDVLRIFVIAFLISLFAAFFPAWRASRMAPASLLR